MSRARRILTGFTLAFALSAALGACGGNDGAQDRDAITRTLRVGLSATDADVLCDATLSTALQTRVYGSPERCTEVETRSAPTRTPPTGVLVSDVRVDGDHATAIVGLRGNGMDSVRGGVRLVREDGGWRLDDLSTAFLRTSFNAGLDGGGTLEGTLVVCVGTKIRGLDDAAMRRLAFGSMGGRPEARVQLRQFVAECVDALNAPASGDTA